MRRAGSATALGRRRFLAVGAGIGAALLAGCSAGDLDAGDPTTSGTADAEGSVGTFRLLISDQPVAIDEFDSLDVSFDRARVFRGAGDDEATATTTTTGTSTETAASTGTELAGDEDPEDGADQEGFTVLDLDGATVDLTQVVGDKAMGVFEGELPAGRYRKIELFAGDVGGVVDGEPVAVTIPSGKLQLVKPFEVAAGESLSYVFDINVVRKGQSAEYNLLPVISESGVAGEDVAAEEVTPGEAANGAGGDGADGAAAGGPPDDASGNQSDDGDPAESA